MATALALGRAAARTTRRRLPLTATLTLAVLVLGAVSGALWTPLADGPLRETVGYGLPAWRAGHWWSIVTGAFFADRPVAYLPLLLGLVLVGGVAEWRLGTRRVLVAGVVTHVAGVGGAVVVVVATAGRGWDWSTALATRTDLGMTSAVLGTAAAVSATCSPTWRLRLRAVVVGYAAFALLLVGGLADLERLLAVAAGLAVGPALASAGHPSRYASRASRRLVIAIVLAIVASLHLALAAERCPLIFAGTGSAPERAATTTFLHDGSAVLVPLLLVIAAVCVWHGGRRAGWGAVGIMALVTLAHLAPLRWLAAHHTLWWPLAVFAAVDLALLAAVTFLVLPPSSRRPPRVGPGARQDQRELVRQRLRAVGSTNRLAWMTTWPQNQWFHGGAVHGYLAHRVHAGVAIGLCDPVGVDDAERAGLLREFADRAHRRGLVPCVFAASAGTAAAAATMGWRIMPVGEEAVLELAGLTFQGKAWQDIRTALNHAGRREIRVEIDRLDELPADLQRQVAEISCGWTTGRRLPELGFTLGGLDEAADPEVRVAVAVDAAGLVHGVTSWLPSHRPSDGTVVGWTLDVMRRRQGDEAFRAVMELLIAASLLRFRDEGCDWASLSASPLAQTGAAAQPDTPRRTAGVDLVLRRIAAQLEPFYGFRSLHAFKAKFSPRFEPLYLVYPDDLALPRISVALTRAYLPDVRLRDIAALRRRPRPASPAQASTPRPTRALSTAAASSAPSIDT